MIYITQPKTRPAALNTRMTTTPAARGAALLTLGISLMIPGLATTLATTVVGCASSPNDPTGAISITVKPGDTGTCDTSPCQVSLVMPPGSGSYEVTGNQVKVGTYPAGQTVNLGSYWDTQRFDVVGAKVPPVYVYIPKKI